MKLGWASGLSSPKIPSNPIQIGTSHGYVRDFSSELTKNTPPPPHVWNFWCRTWGLQFRAYQESKNTPPPRLDLLMEDLGEWCVEIRCCIPADTASFHTTADSNYNKNTFCTGGQLIIHWFKITPLGVSFWSNWSCHRNNWINRSYEINRSTAIKRRTKMGLYKNY